MGVELSSGNFWGTARVNQGVHVWRPEGEHLDAGQVRELEPALLDGMRAVKGESLAPMALGCGLSGFSPPPRPPTTPGLAVCNFATSPGRLQQHAGRHLQIWPAFSQVFSFLLALC